MINASIIKGIKDITVSGLPFMEGKEKLEVEGAVVNTVLTVNNFGFLEGEEGEYVVLGFKEYPLNFIYGSSVVTDSFKKLQEKYSEHIPHLLEEGLPIKLTKISSKNKRTYTKVTFYPGE